MKSGYLLYPTIIGDTVAFVYEDQLRILRNQRELSSVITTNSGSIKTPIISPDKKYIAYLSNEEGYQELFVANIDGTQSRRLTYLSSVDQVVGWKNSSSIIFSSSFENPMLRTTCLYVIDILGGLQKKIDIGSANYISYASNKSGANVIQRNADREYSYWKNYQGGLRGELWISKTTQGHYKRLIQSNSSLSRPLWIGERIYFIKDIGRQGNIYSCDLEGKNIRQETFHKDFYVRHINSDGISIIYHLAGDLWVYDIKNYKTTKLDFTLSPIGYHTKRKFEDALDYIHNVDVHPKGKSLLLTARGQTFYFPNYDGPVNRLYDDKKAHRISAWSADGKKIYIFSDHQGEECLEGYYSESQKKFLSMKSSKLGRVTLVKLSLDLKLLFFINHKNEIGYISLKDKKITILDRSAHGRINGFDYSNDSKWITYNVWIDKNISVIKLCQLETKKCYEITPRLFKDVFPSFDSENKYICFLSQRDYKSEWDSLHFDLNFRKSTKPFIIHLKNNSSSLFNAINGFSDDNKQNSNKKKKDNGIEINIEGIKSRQEACPIPSGVYYNFFYCQEKFYLLKQNENSLHGGNDLYYFEVEDKKLKLIDDNVDFIDVSSNKEYLYYQLHNKKFRVIKGSDKLEDNSEGYSKQAGWVDLDRIKVEVTPEVEWKKIFYQAWRLQKEHFWTDKLDKEWLSVKDKYKKLLPKLSSRIELNDLLWEMQGELRTSHAYVMGGDYSLPPHYMLRFLGVDYNFCNKSNSFEVTKVFNDDSWSKYESSPLSKYGSGIKEGDLIYKINNKRINKDQSIAQMLCGQGQKEVLISYTNKNDKKLKKIAVYTLKSESALRYRNWVESNRRIVKEKTNGKVGYIHIPDMSKQGYEEFMRSFLLEKDCIGLIIDIRYNFGGCISPLILQKLSVKRLGYDISRWEGLIPYPIESPRGSMVSLINEKTCSDGDVFAHSFRLLGLGPIIGKRTWGGTIGYEIKDVLLDNGMTTQPEYSIWFYNGKDKIENYGVDPDIDVDIFPQDYAKNYDRQLDTGINVLLKNIKK